MSDRLGLVQTRGRFEAFARHAELTPGAAARCRICDKNAQSTPMNLHLLPSLAMAARAGPSKGSEIQALEAQNPPEGTPFSLDDLILTEIEYRGKALYAKIRIDEAEGAEALQQRFKQGEEGRGRCTLVSKVQRRKSSANQATDTEWRLTCCYGKHDKRDRQAACDTTPQFLQSSNDRSGGALDKESQGPAPEGGKKARRKKAEWGDSIKLGCTYAVNVKQAAGDNSVLLIRVSQRDHVGDSGQAVHADRSSPHLSTELRDWVWEKLCANMPTKSILAGVAALCDGVC